MLVKPLAACTYLSSIVSQLFEQQEQKNRRFYVPRPTFLLTNEDAPTTMSKMLDNSMLAKRLAACTYLYSIVSELYDT